MVALSIFAAYSDRLKFGTSVLAMPLRNPVVLAKQIATLDYLSQGGLFPAVGSGGGRGVRGLRCFQGGPEPAHRRGHPLDAPFVERGQRHPRRGLLLLSQRGALPQSLSSNRRPSSGSVAAVMPPPGEWSGWEMVGWSPVSPPKRYVKAGKSFLAPLRSTAGRPRTTRWASYWSTTSPPAPRRRRPPPKNTSPVTGPTPISPSIVL